jgi:hypothetical protein
MTSDAGHFKISPLIFNNNRMIISTCHFPKLSDQPESVIHLPIVSYWLKGQLPSRIPMVNGEALGELKGLSDETEMGWWWYGIWMDRAFFGDQPLIVFITIYCFLLGF